LPSGLTGVVNVLASTFQLETDRSRLLTNDLGHGGLRLYLVPTEDERVCFIVPRGPAGCVATVARRTPNLTVFQPSAREGPIVFGFVAADATKAVIVAGTKHHVARLKGGAYWYALAVSDPPPRQVRISYSDGKTVSTPILTPSRIRPATHS
jgi:hypothetical protein